MLDLELAPGDKVHVGAALNGGLTPMEIKLAVCHLPFALSSVPSPNPIAKPITFNS